LRSRPVDRDLGSWPPRGLAGKFAIAIAIAIAVAVAVAIAIAVAVAAPPSTSLAPSRLLFAHRVRRPRPPRSPSMSPAIASVVQGHRAIGMTVRSHCPIASIASIAPCAQSPGYSLIVRRARSRLRPCRHIVGSIDGVLTVL